MSEYVILDGRVTMDPDAFARFCETRSMAWCGTGPGSTWSQMITVDAYGDKIMLEALEQMMQNLQLLPDLHKAAQAGQVDGAFTSACVADPTRLEAVVFDNSELSAGWGGCLNSPVGIGPAKSHKLGWDDNPDPDMLFSRVDGSTTKHCVVRCVEVDHCCCGGVEEDGQPICRNGGKRIAGDDGSVVDIATYMPPRATGQLEQALVAAAGVVNAYGRWELGRVAWNANRSGLPGYQNMFRRWLETFTEAAGERHVMWVPDLFDEDWRRRLAGAVGKLNFRPVCANTGGTQRGQCPAFLTGPGTDTIRVPAHVDNASLADAAKLAAGGADPAEAVAVIAAITDPDRR